jgi:hypothetical protein
MQSGTSASFDSGNCVVSFSQRGQNLKRKLLQAAVTFGSLTPEAVPAPGMRPARPPASSSDWPLTNRNLACPYVISGHLSGQLLQRASATRTSSALRHLFASSEYTPAWLTAGLTRLAF